MHNVAHQTKDGERKLVTKYVRNGQGNTLGICGRCTIKQCMWFCICAKRDMLGVVVCEV